MSIRESNRRLSRLTLVGIVALAGSLPLVVRGVMIHREHSGITIGYPGAGVLMLGAFLALVATCLGAYEYQWTKIDDERREIPSLALSLIGLAVLAAAIWNLGGVFQAGGGN